MLLIRLPPELIAPSLLEPSPGDEVLVVGAAEVDEPAGENAAGGGPAATELFGMNVARTPVGADTTLLISMLARNFLQNSGDVRSVGKVWSVTGSMPD